jgi:hypothetical protein
MIFHILNTFLPLMPIIKKKKNFNYSIKKKKKIFFTLLIKLI